jgi:hypothetical protein
MLIREINEKLDPKEIDFLDDLEFFMNNDPIFYRRVFYPLLMKFKRIVKSGKTCKDTAFRPCVDRAVDFYCKKFNITDSPDSLFTNVDRDAVARKIFGQERDRIQRGEYDDKE